MRLNYLLRTTAQEIERVRMSRSLLQQSTNKMPIKEKISAEEAKRFKEMALRISFQISQECGPAQHENVAGQRYEHNTIFGFNGRKAEQLIEDMIWEFLMKG